MFSRVEIKKENRQRRFLFYSQKQKCTRNLICGWKHLATRKKQLAVFSGHGLIRTNTYRTFCGSGGYDLCRAAGYDASQLDAVRKRSEGGRSSHTRMHSFAHNPRRTQHVRARSNPSKASNKTHARPHARTHTRPHARLPRLAGLSTATRSGQARYGNGAKAAFPRAHARTLARTISRKHSSSIT